MMYMVFIIEHIHHLINESKMQSFIYNSDQMVYITVMYDESNKKMS